MLNHGLKVKLIEKCSVFNKQIFEIEFPVPNEVNFISIYRPPWKQSSSLS